MKLIKDEETNSSALKLMVIYASFSRTHLTLGCLCILCVYLWLSELVVGGQCFCSSSWALFCSPAWLLSLYLSARITELLCPDTSCSIWTQATCRSASFTHHSWISAMQPNNIDFILSVCHEELNCCPSLGYVRCLFSSLSLFLCLMQYSLLKGSRGFCLPCSLKVVHSLDRTFSCTASWWVCIWNMFSADISVTCFGPLILNYRAFPVSSIYIGICIMWLTRNWKGGEGGVHMQEGRLYEWKDEPISRLPPCWFDHLLESNLLSWKFRFQTPNFIIYAYGCP